MTSTIPNSTASALDVAGAFIMPIVSILTDVQLG